MNKLNTDIAKYIRKARRAKDLTQQELAKLTGTSPQNISSIEVGGRKNLTLETIQKIATALDLDLDILLAPKV